MIFKLDTGSDCNILPKKYVTPSKIMLSRTKLTRFLGGKSKSCGKCVLTTEYKGNLMPVEYDLVDIDEPPILGWKTCEEMKLVKRIYQVNGPASHNQAEPIRKEFEDVLETKFSCLKGHIHHINMNDDVKPAIHAPIRVPHVTKERR